MVDRDGVVVADRGAGRGTTLLGWLALLLSILALVLAWIAYDRTGGNLDDRIQQGVQQGVEGIQKEPEETNTTEDGTTQQGTDTTDTDTTTDGTTTDPTTEMQQ